MIIKGEDMKPDETDLCALKMSLYRNDICMMFTVKFGEEPYIIGAPHHTPGGTDTMPTIPPRKGDENVGYLALILGKHLGGQCIIASNYWLDPNKTCNDYLLFIKREHPKFLIEIHGHRGKPKYANYDIEISCGTDKFTEKSKKLANFISDEVNILQKNGESFWNDVTVCGEFNKLFPNLRASNTLSLKSAIDCEIIPYHIEISKDFRIGDVDEKDENKKFKKVPKEGEQLMKIIADSLKNVGEK